MTGTATLANPIVAELRHELRTPVNLIVGYTEMLLEDTPVGDPRAATLEEILTAAREVLDAINTALPPTGGTSEGDLARLIEILSAPQHRILAAVAALHATTSDQAEMDDLTKIATAAARLTAVPRPVPREAYTPASPTPRTGEQHAKAVLAGHARSVVVDDVAGSARILVVDDVEDNRAVLARRLIRQGYAVETAENGRIALDRLEREPFDLVLLDVMMPEVDGFQVLERMRANPKLHDVPVIMISALDDLSSVVRCIEFGAEDYLAKPFDPVLLRARIGAALEKKRFRDREADYLRQVGRVIDAAGAVEHGRYSSALLAEISRRDDELGRLARVFDAMVAGVQAREERLREQLGELRTDVSLATREIPAAGPDETETRMAPGTVFAGRYTIARAIGRGGMGTVYLATDRDLGDEIAIKLLRTEVLGEDETAIERFKNEIRLARRISHRNVVRTHDFGECDGAYFVTMEYVRGITVRELLHTRGKLGVSSTLALGRQLVEALAVAHDAGIIHRDVKPENALLDAGGVLKVMDFGIARLAQRSSNMTQAGMVVGTPTYMAPEQLMEEEIDARADLYAAGVVLYECLTGVPPFTGASPIAMISKVLTVVPVAPAVLNPEVPPAFSALVMRLLAKEPHERPADARRLLELLAELR